MIVEPEQRVADFAKAGSDIISVHAEQSSTIHLHRLINAVRSFKGNFARSAFCVFSHCILPLHNVIFFGEVLEFASVLGRITKLPIF